MFHTHSSPKAILHIDGDAFFASCEQSRDPKLKGKPVVTGKERGIAASMSYEAKARGVTRGMPIYQIRKVCPEAVILPSDYETYSLLSKRLYAVVRRYTPDVEEYGIDECFADITGLRRVFRTSYLQIAEKIKKEIDMKLGFTFSIGLAPTKVLAKVASKWKKPSGLTSIPARDIDLFLNEWPVEKVWGIGPQTAAFLNKKGIRTALQFATQDESWVKVNLTKPFFEIWNELNGIPVLPLATIPKETYASIQKFKTFTPPSNDKRFIFSQLSKNIENACMKARRYSLAARDVVILLRTQDFHNLGLEMRLEKPSSFPHEIISGVKPLFEKIFDRNIIYRSTGVVLSNLDGDRIVQPDLFRKNNIEKYMRIYESFDSIRQKYGKHTLFLGSSFMAHKFSQHLGERGDNPVRRSILFKDETSRRHLNIPMFIGDVT